MEVFTVSFFGHRKITDYFVIERKLEGMIHNLILSKQYIEFLVGRDGEFDQLVSSTIRRCIKKLGSDHISLVLVLPYITAEYKNNVEYFHQYYSEVEICDISSVKYFKEAHRIRNRAMIDRSSFVVFNVDHPSGGAYQTMSYAKRIGRKYINLADV